MIQFLAIVLAATQGIAVTAIKSCGSGNITVPCHNKYTTSVDQPTVSSDVPVSIHTPSVNIGVICTATTTVTDYITFVSTITPPSSKSTRTAHTTITEFILVAPTSFSDVVVSSTIPSPSVSSSGLDDVTIPTKSLPSSVIASTDSVGYDRISIPSSSIFVGIVNATPTSEPTEYQESILFLSSEVSEGVDIPTTLTLVVTETVHDLPTPNFGANPTAYQSASIPSSIETLSPNFSETLVSYFIPPSSSTIKIGEQSISPTFFTRMFIPTSSQWVTTSSSYIAGTMQSYSEQLKESSQHLSSSKTTAFTSLMGASLPGFTFPTHNATQPCPTAASSTATLSSAPPLYINSSSSIGGVIASSTIFSTISTVAISSPISSLARPSMISGYVNATMSSQPTAPGNKTSTEPSSITPGQGYYTRPPMNVSSQVSSSSTAADSSTTQAPTYVLFTPYPTYVAPAPSSTIVVVVPTSYAVPDSLASMVVAPLGEHTEGTSHLQRRKPEPVTTLGTKTSSSPRLTASITKSVNSKPSMARTTNKPSSKLTSNTGGSVETVVVSQDPRCPYPYPGVHCRGPVTTTRTRTSTHMSTSVSRTAMASEKKTGSCPYPYPRGHGEEC